MLSAWMLVVPIKLKFSEVRRHYFMEAVLLEVLSMFAVIDLILNLGMLQE